MYHIEGWHMHILPTILASVFVIWILLLLHADPHICVIHDIDIYIVPISHQPIFHTLANSNNAAHDSSLGVALKLLFGVSGNAFKS